MPRDFYFLPFRTIDIWAPAAFTPQELAAAGNHYLHCVARLKPGVTIEQAKAAMTTLGKQMLAKTATTRVCGCRSASRATRRQDCHFVDRSAVRGGLRAADFLRQSGQPAAGPRRGARTRSGRT